jgi:hypothetical protein
MLLLLLLLLWQLVYSQSTQPLNQEHVIIKLPDQAIPCEVFYSRKLCAGAVRQHAVELCWLHVSHIACNSSSIAAGTHAVLPVVFCLSCCWGSPLHMLQAVRHTDVRTHQESVCTELVFGYRSPSAAARLP